MIPRKFFLPFALLLTQLVGCSITISDDRPRVSFALAADAAPPGLMDKVRQEAFDTDWVGDTNRMAVASISVPDGRTLYLVDPSVVPPKGTIARDPYLSPLCGKRGCRYLGLIEYEGAYKTVLDIYAQSLLPPGEELFQVEPRDRGLPCLVVTEYPNAGLDDAPLLRTRYCFDGQRYRSEGTTRHLIKES